MPATDVFRALRGRGLSGPVRLALACALALAATGCERQPVMPQDSGVVVSARFGGPPGSNVRRIRLPNPGRPLGWPSLPSFGWGGPSVDAKLGRQLRDTLAAAPGGRWEVLLVDYHDPLAMPRFPLLGGPTPAGISPDSVARKYATHLVDSLSLLRAPWYGNEGRRLRRMFGAAVQDSFWLTRSLEVRIRLRDVRTLAARPDVEWIGFAHRGPEAPVFCDELVTSPTSYSYTGDGRDLIDSDRLRDAGYATGRISLLDTGVWTAHQLLAGPALNTTDDTRRGLVARDCVSDEDCEGSSPTDTDVDVGGHGTINCGILVGDVTMGGCLEGATNALLECHRVYQDEDGSGKGELDPSAFRHACEQLLENCNPVAIIEVASEEEPGGSIGRSTARLYDAGVAVISAAGNGGSAWLGSPGSHRNVLAVGARPVSVTWSGTTRTVSLDGTAASQSYGSLSHRRKPDLQAPTGTASAGCGGADDRLTSLAGTSGATPYAGAAALILRNWMMGAASSTDPGSAPDPGQVYAALLACADGTRSAGGEFPLESGAGMLRLPGDGQGWWGKLDVGKTTPVEIPLAGEDDAPAGFGRVHVAIWWSDPAPATGMKHRDIDLELVDASGTVVASSAGTEGVFERLDFAPASAAAPAGAWVVRVVGKKVGATTHTVYFAAISEP